MNKQITEYEYEDMGIHHSQYFPGAGVSFTKWERVYVGVGDTAEDAMNDAAEMAAQSCEWADIPSAQEDFNTESAHEDCDDHKDEDCELHHYVALFIR